MPLLAILSDLHCNRDRPGGDPLMDHLLAEAVQRLNTHVRPDVVVIPGDLIENPEDLELLQSVKDVLDRLNCPYLVLPGNHDPVREVFYSIFPDPGPQRDVAGIRFLCFVDPEAAGHCATRPANGIERMHRCREDGFEGVVIALQHVAVMPPGAIRSPHRYTNTIEVLAAMERSRIDLAIGGHVHFASKLIQSGRSRCLSAGKLGEPPHPYTLIKLDSDSLSSCTEFLVNE
ncbi:MAG: metallophosphoesterase [Verrucomicrobia bacterium]|nr:metallophosphoesterase [Verrucomicrobiota bacterium]MDA1087086.1 metallophosphoesterase [Verrucomicrobiota bacterium]